MSKKSKIIVVSVTILLICALIISLIVVDCLKKKKEMLAVNQSKVQIFYEIGDEFNEESVDVYFEDDKSYVYQVEDYVLDISQFDSSKEGEYPINVTYRNTELTFKAYVFNKQSLKKVFYDDMMKNISSVLVNFSDNTMYLYERNCYIDYKEENLHNKVFYISNIYKLYDALNEKYLENKKLELSQFFEIITKETNYSENLNLAQNYVKLYFESIFGDDNFEYVFKDGLYLFTNPSSSNSMEFNTYAYLERVTSKGETFEFYPNAYFEIPELPDARLGLM